MPTVPEVDAKIDTDLPTNSVGQITASRLRGVLHYISSALGGGTVTSGAVPEATRTVMQTLSFASPPDSLRTNGFNEVGVGAATYLKAPGNAIPAHWPTSGVLTTGDGTNYLITPTNGELWVEQFSAKGRVAADTTDQWQAFQDCKLVIMLQGNPAFPGLVVGADTKMRVGKGTFYLAQSFSINVSLILEGSGGHNGGTTIRSPWNVTPFVVQHGWGVGTTIGSEGDPMNAFAQHVGHLVFPPGSTHIYKATNTGNANESSPPTGTGTGITSGTATFDYVRERTWDEINGFGGSYSQIRNFQIWGTWGGVSDINGYDENQTVADGGFHCGVLLRTKATVEDCYVLQFPGHGIGVAADGDPELRGSGNANGFIIRHCRLYYNGHAGLRIGLSDSNAGSYYDIDTGYNHRGGVEEYCFLGNRCVNLQDAFSGSHGNTGGKFLGGVTHNGYVWLARAPELGGDTANYTNAPGTDEFSWIRLYGDGTTTSPNINYPNWSASPGPSVVYAPCAGYLTNNANAANQVFGLYIEGGGYPPQIGVQDMVWGLATGNGVDTTRGGITVDHGRWQNSIKIQSNYSFAAGQKTALSQFGADCRNNGNDLIGATQPDYTVWSHTDYEGYQYKLHYIGANAKSWQYLDVVYEDLARPGTPVFGWTGTSTHQTFGRGGTNYQPNTFFLPKLALSDGSAIGVSTAETLVQMSRTHLGTGTTSAGTAKNGELYIYANPSTGDPWGWQVRGGFYVPLMP